MWYNASAPPYALLTKAVSCKCDLLCILVPLVMNGIGWGGGRRVFGCRCAYKLSHVEVLCA